MVKDFFKGAGIALLVMLVLGICWWIIKFIADVVVTAFGFVVGLFAPWVLVLIIAVIAGFWYAHKKKVEAESVVIVE